MIKLPMDVYLKTLAGYINDEDKLVTYKWFSSELEVHVNVAKQILEEYWNKYKNDGIAATVMIIGYLKDGEMRVELVKESNLENAKEKYNKIISQHIYSLQKTLPDIELLAGTGEGDSKYGAIHCAKSVLLTEEELFARRWGGGTVFHAPPEERKPPVDKSTEAKKSNGIGKFLKAPEENKKIPDENVKNVADEKTIETKTLPPKNKTSPKKSTNSKKPAQSQKKGFSNLFGKVSVANQKKSPPLSSSSNNNTLMQTDPEPIKENVNNTNNCDKELLTEERHDSPKGEKSQSSDESFETTKKSRSITKKTVNISKLEPKINKKKETNRGKKRDRSQESKIDLKKRKRIIVASDSSEESAASDNEIIFDSPPRVEITEKTKSPSPPPVENIKGKRKIHKTVDQTYMDDDGYLVTKKTHVYESCSEEDEPVKAPEPKKTVEPPVKIIKKQTTLMNFFKKA